MDHFSRIVLVILLVIQFDFFMLNFICRKNILNKFGIAIIWIDATSLIFILLTAFFLYAFYTKLSINSEPENLLLRCFYRSFDQEYFVL